VQKQKTFTANASRVSKLFNWDHSNVIEVLTIGEQISGVEGVNPKRQDANELIVEELYTKKM
jgi:hypothetical protein